MHCATLFGNIPIPCSVYKRKIRNEFEKKGYTIVYGGECLLEVLYFSYTHKQEPIKWSLHLH